MQSVELLEVASSKGESVLQNMMSKSVSMLRVMHTDGLAKLAEVVGGSSISC